jgi:hypothetical protein
MKKKFPKPRKYIPKNPQKYIGDPTDIVSRSSYETKFMLWCDNNSSVVQWTSETTIIPYISPIDHKQHRYFVDFSIIIKNKEGKLKKYLIEIKPESQTIPPVKGKKREKTFLHEVETYMVNSAKWQQAKKYATQKGCDFIILTETHLGIY